MGEPAHAPAETVPRKDLPATPAELESGDVPSSFLAEPADLTLRTLEEPVRPVEVEPPSGGPRYALETLLGRGGMASVYRAFDRQLERQVALKILDRAHAEPYLREARSQARVRHDNVLEVFEAGELDGRPYIAMRYVEGPTLLELAAQPLEAKLRLLVQVAEGLHAAHRAGLLHRDVKPSNILVERGPDGQLKPYVADFGIATILDPESGGEAVRAGTPAYMAPEQRLPGRGVDRRADVFSLGATACELLTGGLPSQDRPLDELLAPLPSDVAAIVRKCLAREPAERYPSARAVAEDLRRFLEGEVVEAHAASLAYRLTKAALRHRVLLRVGGVAAVLLLAALVVAAILGGSAMRANQRAEARRKQAEDLIGFMLGDLRRKLQPTSSLALLDDVGRKALQYFEAVPREELSPEELGRRAKALYQIGDVRISQGDLEGAKVPLRESLALAEELVRRDPEALGPHFELGQSYFWAGFVDWKQGHFEAAGRRFGDYLAISRRLVAREPQNLDYRLELHYATSNLGSLRESEGRLSQAIVAFREALAIIEGLVAKDPNHDDWQFELAAAHNSLAAPLQSTGHYEEASHHYRADLEIRRRLVAAQPESRRGKEFLAVSHTYMAIGLLPLARPAEARDHAREAVRLLEALVADDPANADRRFKLGTALQQLGCSELALGERREAERAFRLQAETTAPLVQRDSSNVPWRQLLALAHYHRALALAAGNPIAARQHAQQALADFEKLDGTIEDRRHRLWRARAGLLAGRLASSAGRSREARQAFERALQLLGPAPPQAEDLESAATWLRARLLLDQREGTRQVALALQAQGYRESSYDFPLELERELAVLAR